VTAWQGAALTLEWNAWTPGYPGALPPTAGTAAENRGLPAAESTQLQTVSFLQLASPIVRRDLNPGGTTLRTPEGDHA